jgi:hypothetical protein
MDHGRDRATCGPTTLRGDDDMKPLATLALIILLAPSAHAGIVHDETTNGDLSSDPANPTALVFAPGGNTIIGKVTNSGSPTDQRDYISFTMPAGSALMHLNLIMYSPLNLGFAVFNAGTSSFIPGFDTDALFLSGIHVGGADVGSDLMPLFVNRNVTTNALPLPQLGPGDYCFLIQQTNTVTTSYQLEFVMESTVPTKPSTWGTIKSLYR